MKDPTIPSAGTDLPIPVDVLVLFRAWAAVAAVFYPAWSVLIWWLLPDHFDAPVERMAVSGLFLGFVAWSYHPKFPTEAADTIVGSLSTVYFLHFLSLVHRDGDHLYYLFATLVVLAVVSVGFRRTRYFAYFSTLVIATQIAYSVNAGFALSLAVCFVGFAATLLAAFGCGLYLRERADEKINALLHNMLPAVVVDRLKTERGRYTERCDSVTVLFADIVGFTSLTRSMGASELIDHLHDLFSRFDEATSEFHVEKIKTIGDCYMAVCGAPEGESSHREKMVIFGLRMLRLLEDFGEERALDLELRIGIHTGPLVSGVIGSTKTVYDVWGDTVNLASRMESHGQAGRIQVSADATEGLSSIEFSDPHVVDVKGIGPVSARFVVGVADQTSPSPGTRGPR